MESLEKIKARIESAVPDAKIDIVANASPSQLSLLLLDNEHAAAVRRFLRDDPALRFDAEEWRRSRTNLTSPAERPIHLRLA